MLLMLRAGKSDSSSRWNSSSILDASLARMVHDGIHGETAVAAVMSSIGLPAGQDRLRNPRSTAAFFAQFPLASRRLHPECKDRASVGQRTAERLTQPA